MSVELQPGSAAAARVRRWLLYAGLGFFLLALVAQVTNSPELTSSGTFSAAFRLGAPILCAALGAIYSERVGIVNIGLEGMMILGTWFGAYIAWSTGDPWLGVLGAVVAGAVGGLLHAVATVSFGIDHIISGVAINILAAGVARFMSVVSYEAGSGGGATQSPRIAESIGAVNLPFLAGGTVLGWQTPDLFGWLERQGWFLLSDVAGLGLGLTGNLRWLTLLAVLLVPVTYLFLWRTPLGLRMRSVGEHPLAAESLGVRVYSMKYLGVTLSGGFAGLGGVMLVLTFAGIYREGQTGGRGFIGLAAMIFGNWRPGGAAAASGLFGYADALQLRQETAVHALLLFIALVVAAVAVRAVLRRKLRQAVWLVVVAGLMFWWYGATESVPREFIFATPYVTTLVVLTLASQRLRMPAADGMRYRRGQSQ